MASPPPVVESVSPRGVKLRPGKLDKPRRDPSRLEKKFSRPPNESRTSKSRPTTARDVATSSVTRRLINFLCNSILWQSSGWRWRFVVLSRSLAPLLPPLPPPGGADKKDSRHRGIVDLIKTRLRESFLVEKQQRNRRRIPLFVEVDHVPSR